MPDLVIDEIDGAFRVEVLTASKRWLRISPTYARLARQPESLGAAEKRHVDEHLLRARMFLRNLKQREQTLQRVSDTIVRHQEAFLRHGVRHLVPLTRLQVASELELHVSTVSRAVLDKIARLPDGRLCPMPDFFGAAHDVKDILRELVEEETESLSDQQLADLLSIRGFPVARRTVAKYRAQLNIPPHRYRG